MPRSNRPRANSIVIHCSDSTWGDASVIRGWHTDPRPRGRGWSDIGYHAVILNGHRHFTSSYAVASDGVLERGRLPHVRGAHIGGLNARTLGICLIGEKAFSTKQVATLKDVLRVWMAYYGVQTEDVFGHRELDPRKTCPNFDVRAFMEEGAPWRT